MFTTDFEQRVGEYLEWRAQNLSDDIMSELLTVEFVDETGTTRNLTRQEMGIYCSIVLGERDDHAAHRLVQHAARGAPRPAARTRA